MEDRRAGEAALFFLLDDPSPKVRLAIASAIAASTEAPRAMIHALCRDQIEVASHVVALSPLLSDGDLVDIVADTHSDVQRVVALRARVSVAVSAAIAEVADWPAICDLLENEGATIAAISLRRIVERYGENGDVRCALLARADIPCDVRHQLAMHVGEALAALPLVRSAIGDGRIARVTKDACQQATLRMVSEVEVSELPALVEHLRIQGQLTSALLMHALCQGNIDFFAAAIVTLTGQPPTRVRAILADGREATLRAMYRSAQISEATCRVLISATLIWRRAGRDGRVSTTGSVAELLMHRHGVEAEHSTEIAELLMLVERLNLTHRRRIACDAALDMKSRRAA